MDLRGIGRKDHFSIKTPRNVYSSPVKKLSKWAFERFCDTNPIAIPAELLINRIVFRGILMGFWLCIFMGRLFRGDRLKIPYNPYNP